VIEDDYRAALALMMLIDDWGFACVCGRSSRETAQTLGSRLLRVSAIITDVNIDGQFRGIKDAVALASAIGRPLPTIVTTGYDIDQRNCTFPVLRKPFDPNILLRWLNFKLPTLSRE
jgi:hypothetical protein